MRKFRLYTQFEQFHVWMEEDAIKFLETETKMEIHTELDLANAYRKFESVRVFLGGSPSEFLILDPPVVN